MVVKLMVVLACIGAVSAISIVIYHHQLMNSGKVIEMSKYDAMVETYEAQLAESQKDLKVLSIQLDKAKDKIEYLDKQNKEVSNKVDYLVNKYYYYWKEKGGSATINIAQLEQIDKLGKANNLNPHAIMALTKFEASWNENCVDTSGASNSAGLGQFLGSTGKFVSTKLLHRGGSYNHRLMATDGSYSIEMIYGYLMYLKDAKHGDLRKALESYNGSYRKEAYAERINQYLIKRNLGSLADNGYR